MKVALRLSVGSLRVVGATAGALKIAALVRAFQAFTIGAHAGEPKKKRGNKAGDLGGATLPIRTTATGRPNRSATSKASW